MTNNELAHSMLEYVKAISKDAVVVVFVDNGNPNNGEDEAAVMTTGNAEHWDVAEAIKSLADWLASGIEDLQEDAT